ncbi:MAG: AraC family transcriptional regulator [Clostridia bacterium]|nr:AraC family transcriptional regulator [Clostridia bacterium]
MRISSTLFERNDLFYIVCFGDETVSENAHWGKGSRDAFILHYVLEGEGYFNGREVKESQGFLITPMQMHEYHSSRNNPWKYSWVTFGGRLAEELCKKYVSADENGIFKFDFIPQLLILRDSILSSDGLLREAEALSYFFTLLSYHEKKASVCGNRYVEEAKRYMNANFHRSTSITEIADAIGINDRYLYNLFIKHEGISPKSYLSSLKIRKAKKLLEGTDSTVSEIAVSIGFQDVLSFSRFFAKHEGISPTDYRKSRSI